SSTRVLRNIIVLATVIRVVLQAFGMAAVATTDISPFTLDWWSRWDAPHLLRVAEIGYVTAGGDDPLFIVFLPGYPLAVAAVRLVIRNLVASGLLISYACSIGAAWYLYRYARIRRGHDESWRAVLLFFAFPTAYFLSAPYSEALFMFAVMATIHFAQTDRWGRVGVSAAVATFTRLQAIPLLPVLALGALRRRPSSLAVKALVFSAVGAMGFVAYLGINWVVYGDPLHFMGVQSSHWHNHATAPWTPLIDAVRAIAEGTTGDVTFIMWGRIAATATVVAVLLAGRRHLDATDLVYAGLALTAMLVSSWLISMPRYILGIYPLYLAGAGLTSKRSAFASVIAVCVVIQAFFFWRYARGAWTF
ncbi:MAG: mannosyltransferase family protein, partial [Actinomycetota bacterium]